jgi:hypothetical protein
MMRGLDRGEIHIWHARLEQLDGAAQGLVLTLSPDERDRTNSFRFERDRLLGEYLGVSPGSLQSHYGLYGKPCVAYAHSPHSPASAKISAATQEAPRRTMGDFPRQASA